MHEGAEIGDKVSKRGLAGEHKAAQVEILQRLVHRGDLLTQFLGMVAVRKGGFGLEGEVNCDYYGKELDN